MGPEAHHLSKALRCFLLPLQLLQTDTHPRVRISVVLPQTYSFLQACSVVDALDRSVAMKLLPV